MSTVAMSVYNKEFDAAQALLDLQNSNIQESTNERNDRQKCKEAAQLFLNCFIASNVARSSKRKTPEQELTIARHNHTYHSEESSNKRYKIFKRKPIKYFTVTSGPVPSFVSSRDCNSA